MVKNQVFTHILDADFSINGFREKEPLSFRIFCLHFSAGQKFCVYNLAWHAHSNRVAKFLLVTYDEQKIFQMCAIPETQAT